MEKSASDEIWDYRRIPTLFISAVVLFLKILLLSSVKVKTGMLLPVIFGLL